MTRLAVTAGLLLCWPTAQAGSSLLFAYWEPDRGTPYSWFEDAKDIQAFFSRDYRAAGYIKAYVHNGYDRPLEATAFRLDGVPLEELREKLSVIWWRMLPDPLPPDGVGELVVRLREPLTKQAKLDFWLGDKSLTATVDPKPPPVRIETVGFTEAMDEVFIVVEALDRKPHVLQRLLIDGKAIEGQVLDREFRSGISPVWVRLSQALAYGSYHVYQVQVDNTWVACCVRTYDGWVPLGTYGYTNFDEFARNGCNGHNNFGRFNKEQLDTQARLKMRGVHIIGSDPPAEHTIGHPGLWAFCLMDEPDCQDYFRAEEWPAGMRVGYHAMELERRAKVSRALDPKKLIFLTLDLTYKPANYYIYGPLADVTNPDCYPLSIGADLKMVREVVETARYGAAAKPLTFTFESYFHEPDDQSALEKRRFARAPTVEELRLSIHYAIGAGARGLFNYIHCTERWKDGVAHGTSDYPDLWREIGRCYRTIDTIAPLLALAHPTALGACSDDRVWLRTLIAGPEAALIVCCNEDYAQEKTAFRYTPRPHLSVTIPAIPWLEPKAAWKAGETGFTSLPLERYGEGTRVKVGKLEIAELLLVSCDPELANRLWQRHRELERERAEVLLTQWRHAQDVEAQTAHAVRRLVGEFADRVVQGAPVGAYGAAPAGYWNPTGDQYPVFEFGQNEAGEAPDQGAEWEISVGPGETGKPHSIYLMCGNWGRAGMLTVKAPGGQELLRQEITRPMSGALVRLQVTPPEPGTYVLSFLVRGPGPKGGRVGRAIFVVPDELNPPQVPQDESP